MGQFSLHSSGSVRFLNATISQGSVAEPLRRGEIFYNNIARNLLLNMLMKEV